MAKVTKRPYTYKGKTTYHWVVRYCDLRGNRRQQKCPSKKDADRLRLKIENELADGTHRSSPISVTFGRMADRWIRECEIRHKIGDRMGGETLHGYRATVSNHLAPALGHKRLNDISRNDIQTRAGGR